MRKINTGTHAQPSPQPPSRDLQRCEGVIGVSEKLGQMQLHLDFQDTGSWSPDGVRLLARRAPNLHPLDKQTDQLLLFRRRKVFERLAKVLVLL